MPEITTVVKAKSEYGIKTDEWGDAWANWSKPEYRGTPFDTSIQAGDRVQITYARADNGKVYISMIDKVTVAADAFPPTYPPDDPFPDDEMRPDATSPTSEASGQTLWAKDRLRARTDCIACATGIFKSSLEAGILKTFPPASEIVQYAETLEIWAKETA